jgi:glutathione S-transferase
MLSLLPLLVLLLLLLLLDDRCPPPRRRHDDDDGAMIISGKEWWWCRVVVGELNPLVSVIREATMTVAAATALDDVIVIVQ